MSKKLNKDSPWVLLQINNTAYAISCEYVLSLSQLLPITPMPLSPKEVRGVVIFRGKSIQLIDSRLLLGFKSITQDLEDFDKMLDTRYNDHLNWIKTLEDCVMQSSEFTLTTDPHKCAFGKWYDCYDPKNTNIMFLSTFAKFDKPHKAIHQIGITAQNLVESGRQEDAMRLIESVKDTELKQMLHLFDELKIAYKESRKEIMVVIGDEAKCISLSVDQILSIEHLFEFDEDLIKESVTDTKYLSGVAKRKDGSVVFILNSDYLFSQYR